jgi:hypothetical protein
MAVMVKAGAFRIGHSIVAALETYAGSMARSRSAVFFIHVHDTSSRRGTAGKSRN